MEWVPSTLILGPGGVKGFLEIGAMQALEFFLVLKNIRRVIGVSVGAVVALMWCAGYSTAELAQVSLRLDLANEVFALKPFKRGAFMSKNGFFSSRGVEAILTKLILAKFPRVPTLAELFERTGLELIIVSTNVSSCEPVYLSHHTRPDLSCVEGVLMSISIPLVFEYHELDGQRYIDGALTDPLPVQLHPREDQIVLRIVDDASRGTDLLSYVYTAFSVPMEYMIKEKLARMSRDEDFRRRCRVIELAAPSFNPVNPSMSAGEKQNMINRGRKITTEFIVIQELRVTANDAISPRAAPHDSGKQPVHPRRDLLRRLRPLPQLPGEPAADAEEGDDASGR